MDLQQYYQDNNAYQINERSGMDMSKAELLSEAVSDEDDRELSQDQSVSMELVNLLDNFTGKLRSQLLENLSLRDPIEDRWNEDEKRYQGQDLSFDTNKHAGQVRQVANMTRARVNVADSRVGDLLFPTDEKNWGISSTPNPDILKDLNSDDPVMLGNGEALTTYEGEEKIQVTKSMIARRKNEIASEACENMERTIHDQLSECDYIAESRRALKNCIKLGTGIMKGPSVEFRSKTAWVKKGGEFTHDILQRHVPVTHSVDPRNFVPDMSATTPEEMDFSFERSYLTKRQLRKMLKEKELIPGQVKRLINTPPESTHTKTDRSKEESRQNSKLDSVTDDNRYEIWEYTGEIDSEIIASFGANFSPEDFGDIEELEGQEGKIWFCGDIALKISINPMAEIDGDITYAVVCYEEDPASVFGFGLCHIGKATQDAMNDAFSAMMDNMDKMAGVQVVRLKGVVSGIDGDDTIKRNKVWESERVEDVTKAFHVFDFPNNQAECERVYQVLRELFDEEVQVPALSGGEQGTASQTFGGMAMLMNSVGAIFRRLTKAWDDSITDKIITWYYNWNMNYSEQADIKGDFEVVAKGSSTLLVKEMVNQSILALLQMSQTDPEVRNRVKVDGLLKHWIKNSHLPADDIYRTDEEIESEAEKQMAAAQNKQPEISESDIKQMEFEDKKAQRDLKLLEIQSKEQLQLSIMAQNGRLKEAELAMKQEEMVERHKLEREKLKVDYSKFQLEGRMKMTTGSGI